MALWNGRDQFQNYVKEIDTVAGGFPSKGVRAPHLLNEQRRKHCGHNERKSHKALLFSRSLIY